MEANSAEREITSVCLYLMEPKIYTKDFWDEFNYVLHIDISYYIYIYIYNNIEHFIKK